MQKNCSRFKKLKTKIIKKRKRKNGRRKKIKGKLQRTAKSNIDAEDDNNNKKCD